MANYLPVLLVSVAANSIPDDSAVSTLPRGQVDYLSHNWEEEDVWRSWRNMTRQKNEITNGVRLENASWRTWWKQRNGLGTVTPETLNWLKDSDVTWLYGPLHTAVDWAPPPKPIPDNSANPTSALDLSSPTTHKPILKYRSISELLTSDLPSSPMFSPNPSDDDDDDYLSNHKPQPLQPPEEPGGPARRPILTHTKSDTHITRWGPSRPFRKDSPPRIDPPPPAHTPTNTTRDDYFAGEKSTTCPIASPPVSGASITGGHQKKRHISFNTFVEQCIAIEKPKKNVEYQDDDDDDGDDDEVEGGGDYAPPGRYAHGRNPWGYDDGYEEDEEEDSADEDEEEAVSLSMWDERYARGSDDGSDDGDAFYDDEEQDVIDMLRPRAASLDNSKKSQRSQSKVSTTSSSSSASTSTSISTTSSSSAYGDQQQPYPAPSRRRDSNSTARPTIYPTQDLPHNTNPQPRQRRHRRVAPPLIRSSNMPTDSDRTSQSQSHSRSPPPAQQQQQQAPVHVTIAPIAPTILKIGGGGYGGGGGGVNGSGNGGWAEGFGDEGGSDDGMWGGVVGSARWWGGATGAASGSGSGGMGGREGDEGREEKEGGGTPVELVYVPPFGSNYSVRLGRDREREREWRERSGERMGAREGRGPVPVQREVVLKEVMEDHEDGLGNTVQRRRRTPMFSVGGGEAEEEDDAEADGDKESATGSLARVASGSKLGGTQRSSRPPVPTVVVGTSGDVYDYFEGPDMGDDFSDRRSRSGGGRKEGGGGRREGGRGRSNGGFRGEDSGERSRSRSRSRSKSRTPSPAVMSTTSGSPVPSCSPVTTGGGSAAAPAAPARPVSPVTIPVPIRRSASVSPPASTALLSPPPRGRGSSSHQDLRAQTRGRSSTRTAASTSDREQSSGHGSSLGSLSPDAVMGSSGVGIGIGVGVGGGRLERERERRGVERERDRSRGRERAGKRLSTSTSPDDVQDSLLRVSAATVPPSLPPPALPAFVPAPAPVPVPVPSGQNVPRFGLAAKPVSSSSSSSSSSTSSSTTIIASSSLHRSPATIALEEAPSIPIPIVPAAGAGAGAGVGMDDRRAEEEQRHLQPTPSNSPVISMQAPSDSIKQQQLPAPMITTTPTPTHATKTRSPLSVPAPHPAEPSTSYSITKPVTTTTTSPTASTPSSPRSPTLGEPTMVGKAVGMVSSAGAFLGFWKDSNTQHGVGV